MSTRDNCPPHQGIKDELNYFTLYKIWIWMIQILVIIDLSKLAWWDPRYIPPCPFGVKEVPIMKIRFEEIRWWWEPNRNEHVIFWCRWTFLWLGFRFEIGFWTMWWFFSFGFLFQMLWHCFFQGSRTLAGVNCSYSTPEFCSRWVPDKDAVKIREKLY